MTGERSIEMLVRDATEGGDDADDAVFEKIWLGAQSADRGQARRRIRPRRVALAIALACVGLAGAAVAVGAVGGGDDTPSPTVPIPATGLLDQYALWRTPDLIPTLQGGVCEVFAHGGGTIFGMSCGDGSHLQDIVRFDEPDGSWRYVAFRPDGVTSVTAADETTAPVIDNVFVSDQPIR